MSDASQGPVGVVLLNVGTPDAPTTAAVRRYLGEFLMDGRVIDLPFVWRWLLVHGIILRTRPRRSAEAYASIWTDQGAPLLVESQRLAERVQAELGADYLVAVGMRYGSPSTSDAVRGLVAKGARRLVGVPLFPQDSDAARGSAVDCFRSAATASGASAVSVTGVFYDAPEFLASAAEVASPYLRASSVDHVLFSYHGLPERHVRRADPSGRHCLATPGCCDSVSEANRGCYRAHCYATSRGLASLLELEPGRWSVSFQSRLGRDPWIKPYTDVALERLAAEGVKRLAVLCPAFVADCLETVEEIGIRGRERWLALGGEELILAPCVNSSPRWSQAVAAMVRAAQG